MKCILCADSAVQGNDFELIVTVTSGPQKPYYTNDVQNKKT